MTLLETPSPCFAKASTTWLTSLKVCIQEWKSFEAVMCWISLRMWAYSCEARHVEISVLLHILFFGCYFYGKWFFYFLSIFGNYPWSFPNILIIPTFWYMKIELCDGQSSINRNEYSQFWLSSLLLSSNKIHHQVWAREGLKC